MGLVLMSERELQRVEVLAQVADGLLGIDAGASVLGLSRRQVFRLLKRYRSGGVSAIRHGARGKAPNNKISAARRDLALTLVRENYSDFGPTLAAEMLGSRHALEVSRETLRNWMIEDGLWLSARQRRVFHPPRLRRECFGELIQIDGSDHRWFEDRAPPCTLLVFIDDATSTLMELRFAPSESTFSYFEVLEQYLETHGRPVAFYSDKHSVFRVTKADAKGGAGITQFGRALSELNIEILCANSSQAKGRVERANRTLQDRLVKELRLAGISDMDAGNIFLADFKDRYNAQFAKTPAKPENLHRPLNVPKDRLETILCLREKRRVSQQLTLTFQHKKITLEETELTRGLPGKYVDTLELPDGRILIMSQGHLLPHNVFDKDQRVTHAAVTENKRLGHVLAHIKELQDAGTPKVKVKTRSEKYGYRPNGRRNTGWNAKLIPPDKTRRMASQGSDT